MWPRSARGYGHTLALLTDGTVRAWGANDAGQIGDGSTTERLTPVPVPGLSGVRALAVGDGFSLAIKADGTVQAWGRNDFGELGDGTAPTNRPTPGPVSTLNGVSLLAARGLHTLALRAVAGGCGWGLNNTGQVGDGTTTNRFTFVPVSGLSSVRTVSACGVHSLALLADGTVRAWGFNGEGEVGDGTNDEPSHPRARQRAEWRRGHRARATGTTWRCSPTARCAPGASTATAGSATAPSTTATCL